MSDLPPGWAEATIGDLVGGAGLFVDGDWVETKDQDPDGNVRLTQLADIGEGTFRNRSNRFLTSEKAAELGCTYLEPGDVLVARMPQPLGRACIFPGDARPCVTAVDVCIVRPGTDRVDPRWLMCWINTPQLRGEIIARQAGTTRKRISRKNLGSIEFPVPPAAEQRRIVTAIEGHFDRLGSAEQSLRQAQRRLDGLRRAVLSHATAGEWPVRPLEDVLVSLRNGIFVSRPAADPPGIPIFRISAVRPLSLDVEDVRFGRIDPEKVNGYFVQEGDLLFTRYSGNPDYVGACAHVRRLPRPTLHPDKLIRAVVDRSVADPAFLSIALSVGPGRKAIEERRKTTAGQVGIAGSELKQVPVPLPPLEEQRRIVEEVERQLSIIGTVAAEVNAALSRSAALRRSILAEAFTGSLTHQDASDEAATALLERITAERTASPKRRRRRTPA